MQVWCAEALSSACNDLYAMCAMCMPKCVSCACASHRHRHIFSPSSFSPSSLSLVPVSQHQAPRQAGRICWCWRRLAGVSPRSSCGAWPCLLAPLAGRPRLAVRQSPMLSLSRACRGGLCVHGPCVRVPCVRVPCVESACVRERFIVCRRLRHSHVVGRGQTSADDVTIDMLRRKHILVSIVPPRGN